MKRIPYINNEYYHIYNRGVEKRKIFLNKPDHERFLFILKAFNTTGSVKNVSRPTVQGSTLHSASSELSKLVEVEEYCLMPNHFHLMLRQVKDGGISKFLQRVITGYTMYFNTKYERTGVLFQGRHKSKHVDSDPYFYWLKSYIHLNPLDLHIKNWKEKGIPKSKMKDSISFLGQYRWVSYDNRGLHAEDLNEWTPRPEWQEDKK